MLRLSVHPFSPASSSPLHTCLPSRPLRSPTSAALTASSSLVPPSLRRGCTAGRSRRATTMAAVISPVGSSGLVQDLVSSALTAGVAHGLFHFIQGLVERGFCDLKLNRKLMHITIGMVPLLFWPLFRTQGIPQGTTVLCYCYSFGHFCTLENISDCYSTYLQLMRWRWCSRHSGETFRERKASIQPQKVICWKHSDGYSWFLGFNWVHALLSHFWFH
ncbi:uncharacterized protein [Aegilops tauschii subsp. strangulata]|uniref:Uncharacterized protein n=1 Tax=Aegilops tauschii subsp. strangulata TaxID=200361 RepID=A0A453FUY8_AEGTS